MDYINNHTATYGMTLEYATLSDYVDAVNATHTTWPTYAGDFFPYEFAPSGTSVAIEVAAPVVSSLNE